MNDKNRNLFGTDGIRGRVGEHPMTVDFTMRLASAIASTVTPEGGMAVSYPHLQLPTKASV